MFEAGTIITDPWFWALAVPAVLLTGLAKSGFASGLGALATPMIALTLPVPQVAAIMLPLLLVMDATGLQQLWRQRDPARVRALRLQPRTMAGTMSAMSVYCAIINASKVLPFAALGLIDLRNLATSALLLPLAPLGVWVGVRLVRHIKPQLFYRLVYAGMFCTGVKLLWDGLK